MFAFTSNINKLIASFDDFKSSSKKILSTQTKGNKFQVILAIEQYICF